MAKDNPKKIFTRMEVDRIVKKIEKEFNEILEENAKKYKEDVYKAYMTGCHNGDLLIRLQMLSAMLIDLRMSIDDVISMSNGIKKRENRILNPNDPYNVDRMLKDLEKFGLEAEEGDHWEDLFGEIIVDQAEERKKHESRRSN